MRFLTCFCILSCLKVFGQAGDGYGGQVAVKGTKTGRWHTEKINDRHWFITPEGNGLYILGLNHVKAQDKKRREEAVAHLRKWNFNAGGYEISPWLLDSIPGFLNVSLHNAVHWHTADKFSFTDVFSGDFERNAETAIREITETGKTRANLIGYTMTDTPCYDIKISRSLRNTDWVSYIRSLPAEAAGKKRYVAFLKETYQNDINRFRQAYRLEAIRSFDDLYEYPFRNLELIRSAIQKDDEVFIALIAERIYQLTRRCFDRYDPGALLLSENFKMHYQSDEVFRQASRYVDVICIQAGPTLGPDAGQGADESIFDPAWWKRLYEITGKPVLIADHAVSFYTPEYPRTLWHQFPAESEAALFYDRYVRQVIKEPYIVGYMKCQYNNSYDPLRTLLKQGILKEDGAPYKLLEKQITGTNTEVLRQLYK